MSSHSQRIEQSFKKYYAALCFFASRYIVDGGRAVEDLVQDCFVRVLERDVNFESEEHLRNYLYVAVRNNCLNHLQKLRLTERHQERHQEAVFADLEPENELAEEIFDAEVVRSLTKHIESLPAQCRQVIRLSYVDGLDNESVAESMGLSINTIRAQKMRGKRLLRLSFGKAVL